ncbi:MAG: CDP-glycerol glycerophosphotransferase family protein [Eubacteriaceae bacterium]|nr:CDP-glycerol glycerophosphotransferase family protein [Eubacteriaceae bacterium]
MTNRFIVDNISWERLFLTIYVKSEKREGARFSLLKTVSKQELVLEEMEEIPIGLAPYEDGHYAVRINLSVAGLSKRDFLENGFYLLTLSENGKQGYCYVEPAYAKNFDDLSRVFRYKDKYAYTVTFSGISEEDRGLAFLIYSVFMEANRSWKKRRYLHDRLRPLSRLRTALVILVRQGLNAFYFGMHIFWRGKGNILLMSERHQTITGNLKALNERLKSRGYSQEGKISHSFREFGQGEGKILFRLRQMALLARQTYIFVDDVCPTFTWMKLANDTVLTQVWHSGGGFKAVGYARFGKGGSPHPAYSFHRKYTYALCGSESLIEPFQEMFGIERAAILPFGIPRIDGFLKAPSREKGLKRLYESYPALEGKKMYFYCPTFRGAGQSVAYFDFSALDWDRLCSFLEKEESCFAIRMHPFVKERLSIAPTHSNVLFDLSDYPEINDIFYAASALITDYSSAYYEFALLGKPMLFYTFDREIYEATRGVYQSVQDAAPGKVCDTFDELIAALEEGDYEFYKAPLFLKKHFGNIEENASDRLLDYILK